MKRIVVAGAGGLGMEIIDTIHVLEDLGHCTLAGILDDMRPSSTRHPYLGPVDGDHLSDDHEVILGVGEPQTRYAMALRLGPRVRYASIVHPTAIVSPTAAIREGAFLAPFSYVGPSAQVGAHCILNVYASVGHHASVGDNTVLSPYATVNGGAQIGDGTLLGTHSAVGVEVAIGAWSKIAAGTTANHSVEDGSLVAGERPSSRVMFRPPPIEIGPSISKNDRQIPQMVDAKAGL